MRLIGFKPSRATETYDGGGYNCQSDGRSSKTGTDLSLRLIFQPLPSYRDPKQNVPH